MTSTDKRQTICVGRYLIDFPGGAELVAEADRYYGDFDVKPATEDDVSRTIKNRIYAINNNTSKDLMPERVIKTVSGPKPGSAVIVRRFINTDIFGSEAGYDMDGYFWMEGNQYKFDGISTADPQYLQETIDHMLHIIDIATPMHTNEIPTQFGFCMGELFMKGDNKRGYSEKSYRRYSLAGHPDVTIEIDFRMNFSDLSESLLSRADAMTFPELWQAPLFRVKTLRKGRHPVGDIAGEEILQTVLEPDNIRVHVFTWDAVGKPNNIWAPGMNIQLRSGNPPEGTEKSIRPSVNDGEAIELFDKIVNSLRLRPTGTSAAVSVSTVPSAPLGTRCRSGAVCPQAGWWKANTPVDGLRDQSEYFGQGAIIPKRETQFLRRYDWMTFKFGMRKATMAVDWELRAYPKDAQS